MHITFCFLEGNQELEYGLWGDEEYSKPYTFCHFTTLYSIRIFLTIFSFLFWGEFLEASYSGYMPLLVSLTSHSTQNASGLGGRSRNSSRMLSNEGNKMTAGGCFGRPV